MTHLLQSISCTLTGCCWLRRRLRSCGLAPGFGRRSIGPWGGACPLWATWLGGAPLTGGCWFVGPAARIVIWRNATQFKRSKCMVVLHVCAVTIHFYWNQCDGWIQACVSCCGGFAGHSSALFNLDWEDVLRQQIEILLCVFANREIILLACSPVFLVHYHASRYNLYHHTQTLFTACDCADQDLFIRNVISHHSQG